MKNQVYTGSPTSRRFSACPTTVKAGDPVLLGKVPAFALDDYQANEGGTTFLMGGTFTTTVVGQSGSPLVGHQISPGDALYAEGGVLDVTTNCTTGFSLNGDSVNGVPFGNLGANGGTILSGVTNTAAQVFLHYGA